MASAEEIKALVDQVPPLDSKDTKDPMLKTRPSDGKLTGPVWEEAVQILDPILTGGKGAIAAVMDLLKPVDDGADYKARYVLHAMAQYVNRKGKEEEQSMVVDALLSALKGRDKPIQGFLIRQLQVCADGRASATLGTFLLDKELGEDAANALLAIRQGAVEQFRSALPKAKGKAKLTIIQNLGVLKDARSAGALLEAVTDSDEAVRMAAAWGLANLCEASAVDALLRAADAKAPWERAQMTKACLLLAEKLQAAGKADEARNIYAHLRDTRKDASESYVREAAAKALSG